MTFVPNPNVARLVMSIAANGRQYSNTLYYLFPDEVGTAQLTDLANNAINRWSLNIPPVMADSAALTQVQAYSMVSASAPVVTEIPTVAIAGDLTSPILPGNVTLAISLRTANRGRSARGRIYIVGLTEAQVLQNAIVSTEQAPILTAYTDFIEEVGTTTDSIPVVYSQYSEGVARTEGLAQEITAITSDFSVDTQRRRVSV